MSVFYPNGSKPKSWWGRVLFRRFGLGISPTVLSWLRWPRRLDDGSTLDPELGFPGSSSLSYWQQIRGLSLILWKADLRDALFFARQDG